MFDRRLTRDHLRAPAAWALVLAAGTLVLLPSFARNSRLAAQSPKRTLIHVYHGQGSASSAVKIVENGEAIPLADRRFSRVVPPNRQACVSVINAHPVYFDYTLDAEVDSTAVELSEAAPFVAALKKLLDAEDLRDVDLQGRAQADPVAGWSKTLLERLAELSEALSRAQARARESAIPEPYGQDLPRGSSFAEARAYFNGRGLATTAGAIGDPKLGETVNAWIAEAQTKLAAESTSDATDDYLMDLLQAHARTLVQSREALFDSFKGSDSVVTRCVNIEESRTTLSLKASARRKEMEGIRDTGELIHVELRPRFDWELLELGPVGYVGFLEDPVTFDLVDGAPRAIRGDGSDTYRLGAAVTLNFLPFGEEHSYSLGIVVASDLVGGRDSLDDFFGGITISWRDIARFGVGAGRLVHGKRLKSGFAEGSAVPEGMELADIVEDDHDTGLVLLLSLDGLDLTKLAGGG